MLVGVTGLMLFTNLGDSTWLIGVVGLPVVLHTVFSSVLVDPLPDWTTVWDESDKGLGIPEESCAFVKWFMGKVSNWSGFEIGVWTWTFGCATLEVKEDPFPASNMIAWAWIRCKRKCNFLNFPLTSRSQKVKETHLLGGDIVENIHSTSIKDSQLNKWSGVPKAPDTFPNKDGKITT